MGGVARGLELRRFRCPLENQRLGDAAVAEFLAQSPSGPPSRQSELTAVRSEIGKTDERLDLCR